MLLSKGLTSDWRTLLASEVLFHDPVFGQQARLRDYMLLHIFTYKSSSIYFSSVLFLIIYVKRFKSHVLLQTANLSLYHVTKVSLCLSSIVYYFYKKNSIFTPFLSLRIVLCWLFLSAHHLFLNLNLKFAYRGLQGLFFTHLELDSSRQNRDSEAQSGAFLNRKHGLFHPKYFDNGPLERG